MTNIDKDGRSPTGPGSSPKTVEPASGLDASHSIPIARPSWVPLENAACTLAHIWPTASRDDLEQALRSLSAAAALYVTDACVERSSDIAKEIAEATYSAWWLSGGWPDGATRRDMKPIHAARAEMDALHSLRDRFAGVIRSLLAQGIVSREAIETLSGSTPQGQEEHKAQVGETE